MFSIFLRHSVVYAILLLHKIWNEALNHTEMLCNTQYALYQFPYTRLFLGAGIIRIRIWLLTLEIVEIVFGNLPPAMSLFQQFHNTTSRTCVYWLAATCIRCTDMLLWLLNIREARNGLICISIQKRHAVTRIRLNWFH